MLRCGKGTTWEGGMRLPVFFRWDGVIQPGVASDSLDLAASMDIGLHEN